MIVAGIVVLAIAAVGIVDFSITAGKVPEVPAPCPVPGAEPCETERNEEFEDRLHRAFDLEEDLKARASIYGAVAFIAVLIGLAVALRRTERELRREVFTDLGVASVVALGGGLVLAAGGDSLIQTPTKPVLYPPLGWLAIALLGTLATPRPPALETGPEPSADPEDRGRIPFGLGIALTVAAVVTALIVFGSRGDPCTSDVPDWVNTLAAVSLILAGLGALCGLALLFVRRWMMALVMLSAGPFAAILAAFGTACWN
jgi:hypothetical protein